MFPKIIFVLLTMCAAMNAQVTVANGASFRTEQPVAAGSWAVALGTFTGVTQATAGSLPLPTSLGGARVTVGGAEAPILFTSPTQINFLIPVATTPGIQAVSVSLPGGNVNGTVRISTAGPGLFVDFTDTGSPISGRVINAEQGGGVINAPNVPALRGQVISIYGTGPGALDRAVSDGARPGTPLANSSGTTQVFIGGMPATNVQFSGLNPDSPGLWQINVTIPANLPITGRVPVVVYSDGVDSNEVSIFVQ